MVASITGNKNRYMKIILKTINDNNNIGNNDIGNNDVTNNEANNGVIAPLYTAMILARLLSALMSSQSLIDKSWNTMEIPTEKYNAFPVITIAWTKNTIHGMIRPNDDTTMLDNNHSIANKNAKYKIKCVL